MSDTFGNESFARLWPWPGNILVALFAAWAFYMGWISSLEDVQTAFYGLGAVSLLVLLLGLRTIGRGGSLRRPSAVPYRSTAARREEVEFDPDEDVLRRPDALAPRREGTADGELDMRLPQRPRSTGPAPDAGALGRRTAPDEAKLRDLEAQINREKAERGAQLVKLESAMQERVAALETRLAGGATQVEGDASLDQYLKIDAFNQAVNERLLPRIKEMIDRAIVDRIAERGQGMPAGATPAGAMADEIRALRKNFDAMVDAGKAERAALRRELDQLRAGAAAEGTGGADPLSQVPEGVAEEMASLKAQREIDQREIAEVKRIVTRSPSEGGGEGPIERRVDMIGHRLEEIERQGRERLENLSSVVGEVRGAYDEVMGRLGRIDEIASEAARRIDAFADGDGARTPADIDTLRNALTTIIEQNKAIRQRQDVLSARIEGTGALPPR